MIRISEQYIWNILFTFFFLSLLFVAIVILDPETLSFKTLSPMELIIFGLATFRLTRLIVYDKITAFFREQFYDVVETRGKQYLTKPIDGPRRTLADLLSCPWCIGMWMGAMVVFLYYLTPYSWYAILFLAVSGLGSFIQIIANQIGWRAEQLKGEVGE